MAGDEEDAKNKFEPAIGFPSLAAFIASDKDKSTAIFRRFDKLSARNLLYLQSQLAELEARQELYDKEDAEIEDRAGQMTALQCARNWADFKENARSSEPQKARMDLVKEIRETMKEYREHVCFRSLLIHINHEVGEALVFENTLSSIRRPSSRTLIAFRNVFNNVVSKDGPFPALGGDSATLYEREKEADLLVLSPYDEEDRLTSFLRYYFAILFTVGSLRGTLL